jgi:hypothetical protein
MPSRRFCRARHARWRATRRSRSRSRRTRHTLRARRSRCRARAAPCRAIRWRSRGASPMPARSSFAIITPRCMDAMRPRTRWPAPSMMPPSRRGSRRSALAQWRECTTISLMRSICASSPIRSAGRGHRLANRLQRRLMAQQNRSWDFDQEEGLLDAARLARVVISPGTVRCRTRSSATSDFRDTVVTLLIDNSGSMRGRPITIAAISADIMARTLERCGVKTEISASPPARGRAGRAREDWLAAGKPPQCPAASTICATSSTRRPTSRGAARRNLGLMMREGLLKENIDGEALLWAHNRLLAARGAPHPDGDFGRRAGRRFDAVGQPWRLSRTASAPGDRDDRKRAARCNWSPSASATT